MITAQPIPRGIDNQSPLPVSCATLTEADNITRGAVETRGHTLGKNGCQARYASLAAINITRA